MSAVCLSVCVQLTGVTEEGPMAAEVADIQRSVSLQTLEMTAVWMGGCMQHRSQ